MRLKALLAAAVLAAATALPRPAVAAAADLVIAQVGPLSGPLGPNGSANFVGAKACFDQLNAQGGMHGQKIRFIAEDDQYQPAQTLKLLQEVAQRDRPLAFVNLLGSANVAALLKDGTLARLGIPAVGVTPGAESLRTPGSPWLFHVQAGDHAQLRKIASHLATLGVTRVALAYQDIPFGQSGLAFVEQLAPSLKLQLLARVPVPAAAEDLKDVAARLRASGAQAYVMVLATNSGASFVRDVRDAGDRTPIYGLSYVPVSGLLEKTSVAQAAGVALAQVTPNPAGHSTGLAREFQATMAKYAPAGTPLSQPHLVGYLAARVVAEALRRAGPGATPERVAATLRQLRFDAGGYPIDFSAGQNVGSQFVDIGVIDGKGDLRF